MYKNFLASLLLVLAGTGTLLAGDSGSEKLSAALAAQPEEMQARYQSRHPLETLEFIGIVPGMTVMEALPGGGWYTKVLLPYLGSDGTVIGADYSDDMYPLFGFFSEEQLVERSQFTDRFPEQASGWGGDGSASAVGFKFGSMPEDLKGTADAVLLIRAMHNLARFESEGGFLTAALQNAFDVLKPGGVAGVVQHEARDDKSDDFADGSRGYLKKEFVIDAMEDAGFEYVAETDVNQNEKDQPSDTDIVWRLPPTMFTSNDNPELRAEVEAIGESNRMTLKFKKPE